MNAFEAIMHLWIEPDKCASVVRRTADLRVQVCGIKCTIITRNIPIQPYLSKKKKKLSPSP